MQAITTKYIGPGNVRGSRIKATAQAGSITINYSDSLNSEQNHKLAAIALVRKYGWTYGRWLAGWQADGSCVWVCDCVGIASFHLQADQADTAA